MLCYSLDTLQGHILKPPSRIFTFLMLLAFNIREA
jgi:hypothetical protein